MKARPTFSESVSLCLHSFIYIYFFSLDVEDITSLSLGAIWNFSKGTGSPKLVSDYGAKGPVI